MLNKDTKELLKFNAQGVALEDMWTNAKKACIKEVDAFVEKHGETMYCGFANVLITPARGPMVQFLKKMGIGSNGTYGGWRISWYEIMGDHKLSYTQSMDVKETGCQAFAKSLEKYGIEAYMESRPD